MRYAYLRRSIESHRLRVKKQCSGNEFIETKNESSLRLDLPDRGLDKVD